MADNDRYFNKKATAEITDKDHALSVFMKTFSTRPIIFLSIQVSLQP